MRARTGTLDPPPPPFRARELGDSHFLFEFPFGLPELCSFSRSLCESGVASAVLCPYLICAYCVSRVSRVCVRANAAIHFLFPFWISPPLPCRPTLPARTCNGRVACHSIAHARSEPTHARASLSMCTGARVLARAPCSPPPPPLPPRHHTWMADSR